LLIADPLRQIFIKGEDTKMLDDTSNNFSANIYWPLKNLFGASNSNYATTYGNWVKVYDSASDKYVWVPMSGFIANIMATTSAKLFPWTAPAGLNNGILGSVSDIAVNPTQKQRDLLYRVSINPICYFPGDGYTVWGQKTLQKKPSAFDRINVRRLFLTLEKATYTMSRYFVMQPNTVFTRTQFVNTLAPIFENAKNNDGVYDYQIICDESNNTQAVIDDNTMKAAIYIQPVRTAEFILVEFVATRTGTNFSEIV
jgi:phage tail sheath protein FI